MLDHISASFINDWLNCPYMAYQSRSQHIEKKSPQLILGKLIHEVLYTYVTSGGDLIEIYEKLWENHPLVDLEMYQRGVEMLQTFESIESDFASIGEPICVEKEFLLELPDTLPIKGVIDRIDKITDSKYEVIDYKTGYVPFQSEATSIQLAIYNLAFEEVLAKELNIQNIDEVILSLFYLRKGKISTTLSDEAKENVKMFLRNFSSEVKRANFDNLEKRINKFCPWCDFRNQCGKYTDIMASLTGRELKNIEEVIKYYNELKNSKSIIEAKISQVEEILKEGLINNEKPIETDSAIVEASVRTTRYFNKEDVRAILEPLGLYEEVITVSNQKLDKIAKEYGLGDTIARIAHVSYGKPSIKVKMKQQLPYIGSDDEADLF